MSLTLSITEHAVPFVRPFPVSWGLLEARTLFLVELVGADGVVGRGEAAPLEPYDGVADPVCRDALRRLASELAASDDAPGHVLIERCTQTTDCAPALAAVEMALWDRAGRREGRPVAELLASDPAASVAVHRTIGGVAPDAAARLARAAVAAGFSACKVKVGVDDDVARVRAVREVAGPEARIKVDAGGAWSPDRAHAMLRRLVAPPLRVAVVEEPVSGAEAWTELTDRLRVERVDVELSIDETADEEPGAVTRGADRVELKVARAGGISPLLVRAALVGHAGVAPSIASMFDGPLGIAAAVHAAAALGIEEPLGLATLDALDLRGVPGLAAMAELLRPASGRIAVPRGPGLL